MASELDKNGFFWQASHPPRGGSQASSVIDDYYMCNAASETAPMTSSRGGGGGAEATEVDGGQHVVRNELMHTSYSYTFFHLTLALATMFITTQLTRWFQPRAEYGGATVVQLDKSWAIVMVKVMVAWSCGVVYFLYLLLPSDPPCCCSSSRSVRYIGLHFNGAPANNKKAKQSRLFLIGWIF